MKITEGISSLTLATIDREPAPRSIGEMSPNYAPFDVAGRKSCHWPGLQASVIQRQWPCTLASLPTVSPIVIGAVGLPWHPHCGGFDLRSSSWYGPVAIVCGGVKGVSTRSDA